MDYHERMSKALIRWSAMFAFMIASLVFAQQPQDPGKPYVEAMKKVEFMLGEWEGTGWVQMGSKRTTFDVKEGVQLRAGGTVISFQGTGKDPKTGVVGHDAFGVLSYDLSTKAYSIQSWVMNGNSGIFPAKIGEKRIDWEIAVEGRQIKYSIHIDNEGDWVEKGEVKTEGDRWFQFMEMKLKRKK